MKLLIDDVKLNLLLEQKKQFIGKSVAWDSVLSAISFLVSVFLASYDGLWGISGVVLKTVFVILGLFFTGKAVLDIFKNRNNNYDFQDLLTDINKLNEIAHSHSIVVIKNSFQKFPNKYLVYEDKRWDCDFFLNYKENPNNEEFIKNHISSELKIEQADIKLTYIAQKLHEKFSESAEKKKVYSHKFYLATIQSFPDLMKGDSFECDGKTYKWRSIAELEQDPKVQKRNLDVLNYVKELF